MLLFAYPPLLVDSNVYQCFWTSGSFITYRFCTHIHTFSPVWDNSHEN